MSTYLNTFIYAYLCEYKNICMHTFIDTHMYTYRDTYICNEHSWMCLHIPIYVYMKTHLHTLKHVWLHIYLHTYMVMCICLHAHYIYVFMQSYICMCIAHHACLSTYMYIYMCVCDQVHRDAR